MTGFLVRPAMLAAVLLTALIVLAAAGRGFAQQPDPINMVAIDAIPAGNTATSLGLRDPCVRTEPGATFEIDVTVDAVPEHRPVMGFQVHVTYDPALLEVVAFDYEYFLAAEGSFQPFDPFGDTLPDDGDGEFVISLIDFASNDPAGANVESGRGVLARVTFRALAAGTAEAGVGFDGEEVYPQFFDINNEQIEVRSLVSALVAIGENCPNVNPDGQIGDLPPISVIEQNPGVWTSPVPRSENPGGAIPGVTPGAEGEPEAQPGGDAQEGEASPTPTAPPPSPSPAAAATPGADGNPALLPATGDGGGPGGWTLALIALLAAAGAALAGAGAFILYKRRASEGLHGGS